MRRKIVDSKDVLYIMFIVVIAEMIILVSYQVLSPLMWQREVLEDIDGYSIESMGRCNSDNSWSWQCLLMTFNVICLFVALVLCWRTKDLPSDFSESNYIFFSVMFMFQILLITIPVTQMVQDDPNVFFFIRMGGIFLQNFSVLMLIFVPKMRRIYLGEDTTMSIKKAIAIDASVRRESMTKSFKSSSQLRFFDCTNKSLDCMDMVSNDSLDLPSVLKAESSCVRNGLIEESSNARTNKTAENADEEIADNPNVDYKVQILKDDGRKEEKQQSRVSWRYEASSGGSNSDCESD